MVSSKTKLSAFIIIVSVGIFYGCNYTQTFIPSLNDKQQSIADSINSKYHFNAINLTVKKTWGSGGNHTILTIKFVNGVNIPSNDDTSKVILAWHLGKQIIKALKYPQLYDTYKIDFDSRIVHSDTTNDTDYTCDFTRAQMEKKD
jgi:hypothetical protein